MSTDECTPTNPNVLDLIPEVAAQCRLDARFSSIGNNACFTGTAEDLIAAGWATAYEIPTLPRRVFYAEPSEDGVRWCRRIAGGRFELTVKLPTWFRLGPQANGRYSD